MKHINNLGMPYMGSKRKLSKKLIDFMLKENPNAKYFYDLFGGGGAMSFEALQRPQINQAFYNEFNTGIVELLKDIRDNGITEKYYQWIDRDTFKKHKDDNTWYGGMISTCWSFGNNKDKGYMYGKEIEDDKKLLHLIVVNKCEKSLKTFNKKYELNIKMNNGLFDENMTQRRLRFQNEVNDRQGELQAVANVNRLIQLERPHKLQNLNNFHGLQISNLSYEQVSITTPIDETIVYLDPPYKDTAKYTKGICHKELYKFIENSPYQIYMSSYESHLQCVLEIKHTCSLSATATNEVTEKLYTNREYIPNKAKEIIQGSLFDE